MIDKTTAAQIARAYGLNFSDVPALQRLADDEQEARSLAEIFTEAPAAQLSRADLAGMTPTEINAARDEGRLSNLMTGKEG